MSKKFHLVHVHKVQDLTPHLRRLTLHGDSLADFPTGMEGAHVKVVVPKPEQHKSMLSLSNKLAMRSYTIKSFDPDSNQLTLDFVVNRHRGPATDWAKQAKVGSFVGVAGPGKPKLSDFSWQHYLMVGDITSLNAVNAFANKVPKESTLTAVIAVPTRADIVKLDIPHVDWFIEDEQQGELAQYVNQVSHNLPKDTQVFIGVEATQVKQIQQHLQNELSFERENIYASNYWAKGLSARQRIT
ncbi:siderophore-interacting protein [Photobacterium sp. SDRW27]|uniref:siderophore-interacting protein n=1 Tax=Photobacterium obscurum TaxID=2829490 RepID=UPI002243464C|nr:siderophore-interacting protein [Photobacterium obscurum]MCW8328477.1 siderophore-interacting protein [Photobacterium obscurum]